MTLKTRRYLYLTFILTFFIITPVISLYAAGYQFSLSRKIIQKTGMLIIDTEPGDARIFLNDKPSLSLLDRLSSKFNKKKILDKINKTPAKIKNLKPGEYKVRIEKDGYWPWEKILTVYPGNATFAEDVYLFKNNLPQPIIEGIVESSCISFDKKYIAIKTTDDLLFFDTKTEISRKVLIDSPGNDSELSWFKNSSRLISGATVVDTKNSLNNLNLESFIPTPASLIKPSKQNSNTIYYLSSNKIVAFNISKKSSVDIFSSQGIIDYLISDNNLFIIKNTNNESSLEIINLDNLNIKKIAIPFDQEYSIKDYNNNLLEVYDQSHEILYLINPLNQINNLVENINNIKGYSWINHDKLLYFNNLEIWTLNTVNRSRDLLTRLSEPIDNVVWHPSNNYIIYSTKNAIFSLELDNREKHNLNKLIELSSIDDMIINHNGTLLYFYGTIGDKKAFYKLSL